MYEGLEMMLVLGLNDKITMWLWKSDKYVFGTDCYWFLANKLFVRGQINKSQGLGPLLNWVFFSVNTYWHCTAASIRGSTPAELLISCGFAVMWRRCPGPGSLEGNLSALPASKEAEWVQATFTMWILCGGGGKGSFPLWYWDISI